MSTRRDFIKKSASLAALSAAGFIPGKGFGFGGMGRPAPETEWMEFSVAHWNPNPKRMQLTKMMGVLGGVSGSGGDAAARKKEFEDAGLKWTVLEGVNLTRAQLGVEGRDENIEQFIDLIKECSEVGQKIICYNWMPAVSWSRSNSSAPSRGGSKVTRFDIEDANTELTRYGDDFTHEDLWENMEYFLNAVVPEAEKYDVKLALHPDDPPIDRLRGIPRIITSVDALKRVTQLYDSPYNGLTFCQGSIASQGKDVDIPAAIRWFGERDLIHFVHFRDVRGTPTNFEETWHDDGQNDMYEAMKAYYDVGFRGPIRPDHVPGITGYENTDSVGYTDLGLLFAVGYIRGLMEAVIKSSS
ncbi:mannonate dehydratase [Rhodohalobacter sp. 614A]|uniref:mannonate dehydratase n=1 Tax=Rhodohalobacter sp. 614A TaxID=2908649 RepID=UPI001F2D6366|nr:mannonate dehydratase [Rhodohalobacter sp. 614A]